MTDEIILNRIQCKFCKDTLTSHHRHDYVTCSCSIESVSVDGGRAYLKRCYSPTSDDGSLPYTDLSITSSAPFEDVRNALYRGTFDEKGNRIYKALRDIDDDHLLNIITYCAENLQTETLDFKYYQMEALFRGLNGKDN